jgi:D-3-phosphoglycerate dehydrogenase
MKMIKILICDVIDNEGIKMLEDAGFSVDQQTDITSNQLQKTVESYDALIIRSRTKIRKDVFDVALNLKAIARAGVGLDNIDLKEAKKKGVKIFNSPEAPSNAVAELVIGMMFALSRNISKADSSMKNIKWLKKELTGSELKGKTLGIIGFGNIGYSVALKAYYLGMKVIAYSPNIKRRIKNALIKCAEPASLDDVLKKSDYVSLNITSNEDTRHLMNKDTFAKMKKGAYLMNTSRGTIVDEEALKEALDSGRLAGAALDVYEKEPPVDLTLIGREDVICSPHIGGGTIEAQKANSTIVAQKLIKFFRNSVETS